MTDKRQTATKVKCKRDESIIKQSIFVEYFLLCDKFVSRIFDERACKMALGVNSKASNHAVKGELRSFPLHLFTLLFTLEFLSTS